MNDIMDMDINERRQYVESEFARCLPWIDAALEHGGNVHKAEDVLAGIFEGCYQFWPAPNGAVVTEILCYPQSKTLHIFLGGGDIGQLLDMESSLIAFAQINECDEITITGRRGWVKALRSIGFDEAATTVRRKVK